MSANDFKDRVAVVGMGCTRFGDRWESSADDLLAEAVQEALDSAGMTIDQIDAFWLGTFSSGNSGMTMTASVDVGLKPVTRVENYCATGSDAFRNASYAVASGAYEVVMAVGVEKLKDSRFAGLVVPDPDADGTAPAWSSPAPFAMLAPAYGRANGMSEDEVRSALSRIAMKNHKNGVANPRAQYRSEVTSEQVESGPLVAGMLRVLDCSGVADGAAAAIITRADDAKRYQEKPLYVKSMALSAAPRNGNLSADFDYTTMPEAVASSRTALELAGVTDVGAEIALVELHDCFTPTELVLYEDLGLAPRGAGASMVLDGMFDADGWLPVNPDGGLKSFGHPIGASGLRMLFECWLQLREEAGERQIDVSRPYGMTHNLGGRPGASVSFVSIVGGELG